MVVDLYNLVRDLINESKNQKNLELVDKLIDLKLAVSELQDENDFLKKKMEIINQVERHDDGNYITLKNDALKIRYCSTCWGRESKLIQTAKETGNCPVCYNSFIAATRGKRLLKK